MTDWKLNWRMCGLFMSVIIQEGSSSWLPCAPPGKERAANKCRTQNAVSEFEVSITVKSWRIESAKGQRCSDIGPGFKDCCRGTEFVLSRARDRT